MDWIFRCYLIGPGEGLIEAHYKSGTPELRAKFLSRLKFLASVPQHEWKPEPFRKLKWNCKGLGEVRFKANRVQQRPLGFFGPGLKFTFVLWATEKNDRLIPPSACETGLARKREIEKYPEVCHVCDLPIF